jgi:hypothetical protein
MKNGIAKGGFWRLLKGQKELSMESLEKKYTKELAAAGPQKKQEIYVRMAEELSKQKNHKPSARTLW